MLKVMEGHRRLKKKWPSSKASVRFDSTSIYSSSEPEECTVGFDDLDPIFKVTKGFWHLPGSLSGSWLGKESLEVGLAG